MSVAKHAGAAEEQAEMLVGQEGRAASLVLGSLGLATVSKVAFLAILQQGLEYAGTCLGCSLWAYPDLHS